MWLNIAECSVFLFFFSEMRRYMANTIPSEQGKSAKTTPLQDMIEVFYFKTYGYFLSRLCFGRSVQIKHQPNLIGVKTQLKTEIYANCGALACITFFP